MSGLWRRTVPNIYRSNNMQEQTKGKKKLEPFTLNKARFANGYTVVPSFGQYENGRVAIRLLDAHNGEPTAMVTVNLVEQPCPKGHSWFKTWSENEGLFEDLVDWGMVEEVDSAVTGPFDCRAKLGRILVDPADYA
jgi:hypothetical protein